MNSTYLKRHIALTQEHGSWVFIFSPLIIGLASAGQWQSASSWFTLAAVAVFLFRQPLTFAVKIAAGRRNRSDLPAAVFWMVVYGSLAITGLAGLVFLKQGRLAILALPGAPILFWHLWLVYRRAERRRIGLEIVATGVLALAAPGAYWAGLGAYDRAGWWLWLLTWLQSAGSITYAALRLEQRGWTNLPEASRRFRSARRALLYTSFNMAFAAGLGLVGQVAGMLWLAFAVQWLETLWGTWRPAMRVRPTLIGVRQLLVSILFTLVFIFTWPAG